MFFNSLIFSQCTITAGIDQFVCTGNFATLTASTVGSSVYLWNTGDTTQSVVVNPSLTTTYVVSSICYTGELITNGDFEQGTLGISSQYIYDDVPPLNEGYYFVGSNGNSLSNGWSACEDNTFGNGAGHILLFNGATTANVSLWCQTINVIPNTVYQFSTWATSLFPSNPPVLQFSINGVLLGTPFSINNNLCEWQKFYEIWNSGNNTSATICIVNQNTQGGGNDFAIDDISFISVINVSDTVVVNVIPEPVAFAGADITLCPEDSVVLSANGGQNYEWSNGVMSQNIVISPVNTITYTVTVYDGFGCSDTDDITVNVSDHVFADAGPDILVCPGDSVLLTAAGGNSYVWSNGQNTQSVTLSSSTEGNYWVMVYDSSGCYDVDTVSVNFYPEPVASFTVTPDPVNVGSSFTIVDNSYGAVNWQWSLCDGIYQEVQNPVIICNNPGNNNFELIVYNEFGCSDTAVVNIYVFEPVNLVFPNVITPNNDGINDNFVILNLEKLSSNYFRVFNRWGKIVFETSNYKNDWDGGNVSDGVYYYIFTYPDGSEVNGTITVII